MFSKGIVLQSCSNSGLCGKELIGQKRWSAFLFCKFSFIALSRHFFFYIVYPSYPIILCFNPLPQMSILGSSNSAANKNMMSQIWTNGVQLSDWAKNIVGKEEIARYQQFLLFPQCFQKLSVVDASKWVFME